MSNPFIGLGLKSWRTKFASGGLSVYLGEDSGFSGFLRYTTVDTSTFTLRSIGTVNYEVNWGDGTVENLTTNTPSHTYSSSGSYTITITPAEASTYRPYYSASFDQKIATVQGTGGSQLGTSLVQAFQAEANITSISVLDTSTITLFDNAFEACSSLTTFPQIDTSSATDFDNTWKDCTSLTEFPLLDTSNVTTFANTWLRCTSMTTFPANMFDSCPSNFFFNAFNNCALSAQSIENILVSLDTAGVSSGLLSVDGGSNAGKSTWSTAANDAYDNLIARSWAIFYNS